MGSLRLTLLRLDPATQEFFSSENGCYTRQKINVGIDLQNISLCPIAERRVHDFGIAMRGQEYDFYGWDDFAYSAGCVDTTQQGKANVEQDYVWLRLRSFVDPIQAVYGFAHNLPLRPLLQQGAREFSPRMEIIHQQNAT